MAYTSIRIQKTTNCDCSVYSYPHALGYGDCKASLSQRPPFVPPRRGLGAELFKFISDLESISDIESLHSIVSDFKDKLM